MRTALDTLLHKAIRVGLHTHKEVEFDIIVRKGDITGVDLWIRELNYSPFTLGGGMPYNIACNSIEDAIQQLTEYEQLNTINNG